MPAVVPIDMITTTTITRFEIDSIEVQLFCSAIIRVNVFAGNYRTDIKNIKIEKDDYINWGNDDQYINHYVANMLGLTILEPVVAAIVEEPVIEEPVVAAIVVEPVIEEPDVAAIVEEPVVAAIVEEAVIEESVVAAIVEEPVVEEEPVV